MTITVTSALEEEPDGVGRHHYFLSYVTDCLDAKHSVRP